MAIATYQKPVTVSLAGLIRWILTSVGAFFVQIAEANSRAQAVQQLSALTDSELAKRGIKRDEIVRHVFSDSLYI